MTDIVERARAWGDSPRRSLMEIQDIALQAADEIERLESKPDYPHEEIAEMTDKLRRALAAIEYLHELNLQWGRCVREMEDVLDEYKDTND